MLLAPYKPAWTFTPNSLISEIYKGWLLQIVVFATATLLFTPEFQRSFDGKAPGIFYFLYALGFGYILLFR